MCEGTGRLKILCGVELHVLMLYNYIICACSGAPRLLRSDIIILCTLDNVLQELELSGLFCSVNVVHNYVSLHGLLLHAYYNYYVTTCIYSDCLRFCYALDRERFVQSSSRVEFSQNSTISEQ